MFKVALPYQILVYPLFKIASGGCCILTGLKSSPCEDYSENSGLKPEFSL